MLGEAARAPSASTSHVAEAHVRELPEHVREAALGVADPDARVLVMPQPETKRSRSAA